MPTLPQSPTPPESTPRHVVVATAVLLAIAAALVFVPLGPWLVLAMWFAAMVRPWLVRLGRAFHGRHRAAAFLTVVLFVLVVAPVVLIGISLAQDAVELGRKVAQSDTGRAALQSIVAPEGGEGGAAAPLPTSPASIMHLVQQHGARATRILTFAAGAATELVVGLFVFFWGAYVCLGDGPRAYAWAEQHGPFERRHWARLAGAFAETGRGLLVGVGLTGFAQASVATAAYFALGVPRALVLGLVTFAASLVPTVGTAFVWVPVAAGLALTGQTTKAIVLVGVGMLFVSTVDNVLRPIFSRWGQLDLPAFVIIVSMFGGLALLGGWGLLFGPLLVRLAKEALAIAAERRAA